MTRGDHGASRRRLLGRLRRRRTDGAPAVAALCGAETRPTPRESMLLALAQTGDAADAALARAVEAMEPGWVVLRDCVIDAADPAARTHYGLLHPDVGIVLLDIAPALLPDVVERLRGALEDSGFQARFGGEPPIVYRFLHPSRLHRLGRVLEYAFATATGPTLSGGDAWMTAVQALLSPERSRPGDGTGTADDGARSTGAAGAAAVAVARGGHFGMARHVARGLVVSLWALVFEAMTVLGGAAALLPHLATASPWAVIPALLGTVAPTGARADAAARSTAARDADTGAGHGVLSVRSGGMQAAHAGDAAGDATAGAPSPTAPAPSRLAADAARGPETPHDLDPR